MSSYLCRYFQNWLVFLLAISCCLLIIGPLSAKELNSSACEQIELGFSPEGGAETLILKLIDSAKRSIRLAAYSFTSPVIVRSLINAKKRGVDVAVIVDYKATLKQDQSGKGKAALNLLISSGIKTKTVKKSGYALQHNKYIVVDGKHIQTGSYNYTAAAARTNSENVLVIWNRKDLAKRYLEDWQKMFLIGQDYRANY